MSTEWPFDPDTGEIAKPATGNLAEVSVSELSQALKRTLEDRFGYVRVRGEISGYRGPHSSGHCYFALKDEGAKLDAVIWRGGFARLRSKLQEGLEVIATGKISSYPQKSGYQIIVESIEPAGIGALMALLEERKKKLAAEGLFDAARKKAIPFLPAVIGVVTSPTGAVIRDILHRLADRFPRRVIVWPVRVQGESCAPEVSAAIHGFNALKADGLIPRPDLLIVARGGGSLEDLWGFNEETVVRAVVESSIPVISAVGHETDTTLIDYVSDERAPTPTAAAERAVPVRSDLLANLATLSLRHERGLRRSVEERRTRVRSAARALPRPDDILAFARQRFDAAAGSLYQALRANSQQHRTRLIETTARLSPRPVTVRLAVARETLRVTALRGSRAMMQGVAVRNQRISSNAKLFASLSYKSVLQRGFALVRSEAGSTIRSIIEVKPAQVLSIELADGTFTARAEGKPIKKSKSQIKDQGSLF